MTIFIVNCCVCVWWWSVHCIIIVINCGLVRNNLVTLVKFMFCLFLLPFWWIKLNILLTRKWFKWRLTIKTVTGALYKVFRPTRTVSTVMYRTVQCYGMSKVSRRTVDTGTSFLILCLLLSICLCYSALGLPFLNKLSWVELSSYRRNECKDVAVDSISIYMTILFIVCVLFCYVSAQRLCWRAWIRLSR